MSVRSYLLSSSCFELQIKQKIPKVKSFTTITQHTAVWMNRVERKRSFAPPVLLAFPKSSGLHLQVLGKPSCDMCAPASVTELMFMCRTCHVTARWGVLGLLLAVTFVPPYFNFVISSDVRSACPDLTGNFIRLEQKASLYTQTCFNPLIGFVYTSTARWGQTPAAMLCTFPLRVNRRV